MTDKPLRAIGGDQDLREMTMESSEDKKSKINVLLAEYNTLRGEAIARSGHRFNLMAIGVAAATFFVGSLLIWIDRVRAQPLPERGVSALLLATVFIGGAWFFWYVSRKSWAELEKAVNRVREIELQINELSGEDLLVWENLHGGAKIGYSVNAKRLERIHLADPRPPERTFRGIGLK
jgi:hypothetical protein